MSGSAPLLSSPFEFVYTFLVAIALAMGRPMALFSVLPIVTRLGLPDLIKYALALALSINIIGPLVENPAELQTMSPLLLVFIVLKETLIGLALGIVIGAPFWAIEMAGNILDFIRQAPDATIQDPQGSTESSITGTLLSIFAVLLFLSAGGLTTVVGLLYSSYDIWPVKTAFPEVTSDASVRMLDLLDWMFRSAMLIASPLLLLLIISFVILMIITKFIPQLNVFDMSMAFRNITFFAMIQVYSLYIVGYFAKDFSVVKSSLVYLEKILNGGQ